MKLYPLTLCVILGFTSCDNSSPNPGDAKDSVSTDSLTNPSFNPKIEVDSAAKQMNLDSNTLSDSGDEK